MRLRSIVERLGWEYLCRRWRGESLPQSRGKKGTKNAGGGEDTVVWLPKGVGDSLDRGGETIPS